MGFADWIEYFSVHGIKPDLFHVYPYYTYPTGHLFSIRKCSLESRLDSVDLNEIFYYLDRNLKWFVFYQAVLSTHKITLQIIIVCPSHWIFRIFLFKHDPQLLLTVPLKKRIHLNSWRYIKLLFLKILSKTYMKLL